MTLLHFTDTRFNRARLRFNDVAARWKAIEDAVEGMIASAKLLVLLQHTPRDTELCDDLARSLEDGFGASNVKLALERGRAAVVSNDVAALEEVCDLLSGQPAEFAPRQAARQ